MLFMDVLTGWKGPGECGSTWVCYLDVRKVMGSFPEAVKWKKGEDRGIC